MCGIAGYANLDGSPTDRVILDRMAASLRHRGPDGYGIEMLDNVGLAHQRLAIIDLGGGAQPMSSADGSVWIAFNGEIYNYKELRADFESRGYVFRTSSDTETILAAYTERGPAGVSMLRGMFAFALYDARRRLLLLARDRFGIKPLYYYQDDRVLVFASEVKALLQHPSVKREIDPAAVSDYLTYLYVPGPRSILKNVSKLPPATILTSQNGRSALHRYWEPTFDRPDVSRSEAEWAEEVESTLAESVRLHMRSDVPYGALLSGGLDSSAIVALMARASSQPIRTYTVGFEDADFDEREYARQVATRYGTRHTEVVLRPDGLSVLPELVRQFDEPFADPSALPCFHIARVVADDLKVCLSGDGGDEAFAGYDAYRTALRLHALEHVPLALRRMLLAPVLAAYPRWMVGRGLLRCARLAFADRYIELMCGFDGPEKGGILTAEFAKTVAQHDSYDLCRPFLGAGDGDPLSRMQETDYRTYLPDDILVKVDRTSMLHSLELRVPFIDEKVFDVARRVPAALRIRNGRGKHILRRAMCDLLPATNISRAKRGFGVPLQKWLEGGLGRFAVDVFSDRRTADRGILRVPETLALVLESRHGRPRIAQEVWSALMLELWCRHYLDNGIAWPSAPSIESHLTSDAEPRLNVA